MGLSKGKVAAIKSQRTFVMYHSLSVPAVAMKSTLFRKVFQKEKGAKT